MQGKLSEEHIKLVLAAWKMAPRVLGLEKQLLTALELYESFSLDVVITGGTPEANARLARAVCGLKDEEDGLIVEEEVEEEEEEDEEEEDDEDDEQEEEEEQDESDGVGEELEQSDMAAVDTESKESAEHRDESREEVRRTEHGLPVVSHPYVPNVRVWILNGHSAPYSDRPPSAGSLYDLLVVLTSELRQEDHMGFITALRERDQPLFLVRADQEADLVKEELQGPCKTCAWERMTKRNSEIQRRRREREMTQDGQDPPKLVGITEIGGLLRSVLPEMRKKAFCQFLRDVTQELGNNSKSIISAALDTGKVKKEDIDKISEFLPSRDLTNPPSRLLSILNAMEDFRLDVGVLGPTGCGSSSLINALLGLKGGDEGAAPTGVTETTLEPLAYPYPQLTNVVLWDLPGIGRVGGLNTALLSGSREAFPLPSEAHPTCDVYILLSPLRLSVDCVRLLHHISAKGKQCYLVLSKADQLGEEGVGKVRKRSEEVLSQLGYQQMVYPLSALQPERMDFLKLTETLRLSVPHHKRQAMARHVAKLLEQEIFDRKTELCKTM